MLLCRISCRRKSDQLLLFLTLPSRLLDGLLTLLNQTSPLAAAGRGSALPCVIFDEIKVDDVQRHFKGSLE